MKYYCPVICYLVLTSAGLGSTFGVVVAKLG